MRRLLRLWFSFDEPVPRGVYLRHGFALSLLKYAVDATVVWLAAHRFHTPLAYLGPSLLLREGNPVLATWVHVALALWTLPFLWIGASMSVRRAADAGVSAWLGLLFFVPIVNYAMMLALCIAPARARPASERVPESEALAVDDRLRSAFHGVAASLLVGLPLVAFCTLALKGYGLALFFGTPFLMGAVTGYLYNRDYWRPYGETAGAAALGQVLVGGALLLFALDGLVCVLMALPFTLGIAALGAAIGREIAFHTPDRSLPPALALLALPGLAVVERAVPHPPPVHGLVSATLVDAPPEVVWRHVVEFEELPPPTELLFRIGVAYPQRARIDGQGVGAIRRCEFSTGAFIEPITRWDEPRVLSFTVEAQPDPLREWSPYRSVWAPHFDGFRAVRGEFRLFPLAGGRTRLEGSTWYTLGIEPRFYWRAWADAFVETIHRRVLEQIRREAEAER